MNKTNIPTGLPGGFFIYESGGEERILFAEENIIRLYDCESFEDFLEFTGGSFSGMVHEDDLRKILNEIQAQTVFGEKRHDYVRYRIRTKKGQVRYVEDFGHLMHGPDGRSFFYVFIVDVDRNEYLNRNRNSFAEAQILSMNQETDGLTGLYNMSFFYQRVQQLLSGAESRRKEFAFIHFDIPNFKLYNERHGFRMGDELLCSVAGVIHHVFNEGIVARFSDDHFVVCDTSGHIDIEAKVEQVYKSILLAEDPNMRVRMKAGIYYMDDRYAEVGLACDHARLACNSIKSRHDINYCVYDEMLREKLRKQQYVVDHIDTAIEKGYIKVFYQPVIRVSSGRICGYEALVRWMDPGIGMMNPADFIETLEVFHLIHKVDSFVVRQVCRDHVRLKEAGEPLVPVSVNISRLDFELCDVESMVEDARAEFNVPRNMLDLEITESALNDTASPLKDVLQRLQNKGYSIWLDDFGSGYSSLNTLTQFSFDVMKLDLVFLRSYDTNPKMGVLMNYIVDGAKGMGLSPLSEGVETKEHYDFLKTIGCERAQGYYFGRPMPMDETRAFTREKGYLWEEEVNLNG